MRRAIGSSGIAGGGLTTLGAGHGSNTGTVVSVMATLGAGRVISCEGANVCVGRCDMGGCSVFDRSRGERLGEASTGEGSIGASIGFSDCVGDSHL